MLSPATHWTQRSSAPFALRSAAGVLFCVVEPAQRVAAVVAVTAVTRVGEQDVLVFVVTDPRIAAFRLGQLPGLSTEAASG